MEMFILGQVFGVLATILTFLSYQANQKRALLMIQTLGTVCTCLSFLFLGARTGLALNIVCVIRNMTFYFLDRDHRLFFPAVGLFTVLMIFCGILSWQGPISLLIIVALSINTVMVSLGDPQRLRKSILLTSSLVIVYNAVYFAIGAIASEACAMISSVIGILRYRKEEHNAR